MVAAGNKGVVMRALGIALAAAAAVVAAGCSSPMMKATPFYTGEAMKAEGPVEDRVNLWPIAYYRRPALSVLWPFAELTDDHVALRPVFSVYKLDKERHQWNLVAPFVQLDFDTGEHRVFPVFWDSQRLAIVPVAFFNWADGEYFVVPVAWSDDYAVVFPLVWWYEDLKGIFPAFWWDGGATVFPLYWQRDGEYCHLPPLWWHWQSEDGTDTHVLWPLVRKLDTEDKQGWRVWPFIGRYTWPFGHHDYALWPLLHDYRNSEERTRVAAPFYIERRDGTERWWLLLPAAFRWEQGEDSLTLTPLWAAGRKGEKRWDAVVPLYYRTVDEKKKASTLVTPLIAHVDSPELREWVLLPLLSSIGWGEGETELWAFAPLAHARWGGKHAQHHVLPLYYYDGGENLFLSPLYSRQKTPHTKLESEGFVNVGVFLGHYSWEKHGEQTVAVLPPLFAVTWDADDRDVWLPWPFGRFRVNGQGLLHHLFPLYYIWRGEDGSRTIRLGVWAAGYSRTSEGATTLTLPLTKVAWDEDGQLRKAAAFPLGFWKRHAAEHVREDKEAETKTTVATRGASCGVPHLFEFLGRRWSETVETPQDPARGQTHTRRTHSHWAWPVWSYAAERDAYEGDGPRVDQRKADASLLWRLYDWRLRDGKDFWDDGEHHEYVRSRILWRVMHYERLDGDSSLDVFVLLPLAPLPQRAAGRRRAGARRPLHPAPAPLGSGAVAAGEHGP